MTTIETEIIDLYIELEISRNASFDEIKESFRKLAKIYHPDNKETGNHYKFINIKKSYDILSDPIQRALYDNAHPKAGYKYKNYYYEEREKLKTIYAEKLTNISTEDKLKIVLLYADTNPKFKREYIDRLRIKYFVLKMDLSTQEVISIHNIISGFMIDIDVFLQKIYEKPKTSNVKKNKKRKKKCKQNH